MICARWKARVVGSGGSVLCDTDSTRPGTRVAHVGKRCGWPGRIEHEPQRIRFRSRLLDLASHSMLAYLQKTCFARRPDAHSTRCAQYTPTGLISPPVSRSREWDGAHPSRAVVSRGRGALRWAPPARRILWREASCQGTPRLATGITADGLLNGGCGVRLRMGRIVTTRSRFPRSRSSSATCKQSARWCRTKRTCRTLGAMSLTGPTPVLLPVAAWVAVSLAIALVRLT